jgi:hypothetical protein
MTAVTGAILFPMALEIYHIAPYVGLDTERGETVGELMATMVQ